MKKPKKSSITVLVPAYNEEKHLEDTIDTVKGVVKNIFEDYDILIFDDCSSDKTGQIADTLAKENSKIKVVHNKKNMGLGYNYKQAIRIAQKEYFCCIPGDNDFPADSLKNILGRVGEADIIVPFTANKKIRALYRRIISRTFTTSLNLLFGLNLRYYIGMHVHKTKLVKKIKMKTNSFALQAEILIRSIKKGYSYKEVPMYIMGVGNSKLFRLKNLIGVLTTIIRLWLEFYIEKGK